MYYILIYRGRKDQEGLLEDQVKEEAGSVGVLLSSLISIVNADSLV